MGHPAGLVNLILDMHAWSPEEGRAGHPIWELLGQSSAAVSGDRPLARGEDGEKRRGPGTTTSIRRGSEGGSEEGRRRTGSAGMRNRWVGDSGLWGQQGGAVIHSDKSSSTHPSICGGLGTETALERVPERMGSEKVGNGKCRQC